MKPTARKRANRRNARQSTGPKSADGKSIIARNALRHGLAVSVGLDAALAQEVERLMRAIVGADAEEGQLAQARLIAEAQIDLMRVRKARIVLLANPQERIRRLKISELKRAMSAAKLRRQVDDATYKKRLKIAPDGSREKFDLDCDVDEAFDKMSDLIEGRIPRRVAPPTLEEGLGVLAPKLARLDRYERRALSRRRRAIQEFDRAKGEGS